MSHVRVVVSLLAGLACMAASGTVTTLAGKTTEGTVEGIRDGKLVVRQGEQAATLPLEEVLSISLGKPAPGPAPRALFLADGSELEGTVDGIAGEEVAVRSESLGEMRLPLSAVRAVRLPAAKAVDAEAAAAFDRERAEGRETHDVLFAIRDGGVLPIPATVLAMDGTEVRIRWEDKERAVARERLLGIVFGKAGAPPPPPADAARIALADGSVLRAPIRAWGEGRLRIATSGREIEVPEARVVRIEFAPDRLAYLSDKEPSKAEESPYLKGASGYGVGWPMRRDASARGGKIRIRGTVHEKGLGVHSRSRLEFDLNGDYRTFFALAGIDDAAEARGDCVFRVLGDGRPLVPECRRTGADPAQEISADVAGVRLLVLEVDFGQGFDLGDFADWAEARVVK